MEEQVYSERSEESEILERVFKPGNLAWSTDEIDSEVWKSLIAKGILRLKDVAGSRNNTGRGEGCISFSLVAKSDDPKYKKPGRYLNNAWTSYYIKPHNQGSYLGYNHIPNFIIIVSSEYVLKEFSGQIFARGEFFFQPEEFDNIGFNPKDNTAFGIPRFKYPPPAELENSGLMAPGNPTEINLYKLKGKTLSVPTLAWVGIVIEKAYYPALINVVNLSGQGISIPIVSRYGEVLAQDGIQPQANESADNISSKLGVFTNETTLQRLKRILGF